MARVGTCLWFAKDAEAAVRFYVSLVPESRIENIQRAPDVWPGGKTGEVIPVAFTLGGQSFQALNGCSSADYGTAASISVPCADQAEVDRLCRRSPPTAAPRSCAAGSVTDGAFRVKSCPRRCRGFWPILIERLQGARFWRCKT